MALVVKAMNIEVNSKKNCLKFLLQVDVSLYC
jgi:hypothetical protein